MSYSTLTTGVNGNFALSFIIQILENNAKRQKYIS